MAHLPAMLGGWGLHGDGWEDLGGCLEPCLLAPCSMRECWLLNGEEWQAPLCPPDSWSLAFSKCVLAVLCAQCWLLTVGVLTATPRRMR